MCDKCIQLGKKIEHYERLAWAITDEPTLERLRELLREVTAQKTALHPEQQK